MTQHQRLLIIDFGSQVTQLIARRLRELNVYCEIHPYNRIDDGFLKAFAPKAVIFSACFMPAVSIRASFETAVSFRRIAMVFSPVARDTSEAASAAPTSRAGMKEPGGQKVVSSHGPRLAFAGGARAGPDLRRV